MFDESFEKKPVDRTPTKIWDATTKNPLRRKVYLYYFESWGCQWWFACRSLRCVLPPLAEAPREGPLGTPEATAEAKGRGQGPKDSAGTWKGVASLASHLDVKFGSIGSVLNMRDFWDFSPLNISAWWICDGFLCGHLWNHILGDTIKHRRKKRWDVYFEILRDFEVVCKWFRDPGPKNSRVSLFKNLRSWVEITATINSLNLARRLIHQRSKPS